MKLTAQFLLDGKPSGAICNFEKEGERYSVAYDEKYGFIDEITHPIPDIFTHRDIMEAKIKTKIAYGLGSYQP